MLLPIISFILIALTALKIVLSSCTQASKVNFLKIQSNFRSQQPRSENIYSYMSRYPTVNYSDYYYLVIGSRFLDCSRKKNYIISYEQYVVFTIF